MTHTLFRTGAAAVTVAAVGVLFGCSEDPVPAGPGVSVPPSELVTDVAAIALTEEEVERIREACGDAADLPEPGSPCWDAVADVRPPPGDEPGEPDCTEEICLVGSTTDEPDVVTIRVQDPRPGSPACEGSRVCEGFEVPAPLGARVVDGPPPVTTAPEPTGPESTGPAETGPAETGTGPVEPTEPVEPTDPVEPTGAPPST